MSLPPPLPVHGVRSSGAVVAVGGMKKPNRTVASFGLPSPTGSTSETSDYQRSTPSPREDGGCMEEWSSGSPSTKGVDTDSDLGFSEFPLKDPLLPLQKFKTQVKTRRSCSNSSSSSVDQPEKLLDPRLMIQQVRVALEKIPIKEDETTVNLKRRISVPPPVSSDCKKLKKAIIESEERMEQNRGKITSYLSEAKHFTALRKEKLDRVLNLKTDHDACNNKLMTKFGTNDLFLLSQLKKLKEEEKFESCVKIEHDLNVWKKEDYEPKVLTSLLHDTVKFEVPKTIRFPVKSIVSDKSLSSPSSSGSSTPRENMTCKWKGCGQELESPGYLMDHLKQDHADKPYVPIDNDEDEDDVESDDSDAVTYKCLWVGCKVFGKSSSSKSWLEKHITSHVGNKPFQCIVDNCKMRFGTQSLLERHVNSHFSASSSNGGGCASNSSNNSSTGNGGNQASLSHRKTSADTPPPSAMKLIKKTGKKLKYRKTIYSARIFDLFDLGVMAQVKEKLLSSEKVCVTDLNLSKGEEIKFTSEIIAKRKDREAELMVLLHWKPENILDDEWVPLKKAKSSQVFKISSLPQPAKLRLFSQLIQHENKKQKSKSRRKSSTPRPSGDALS